MVQPTSFRSTALSPPSINCSADLSNPAEHVNIWYPAVVRLRRANAMRLSIFLIEGRLGFDVVEHHRARYLVHLGLHGWTQVYEVFNAREKPGESTVIAMCLRIQGSRWMEINRELLVLVKSPGSPSGYTSSKHWWTQWWYLSIKSLLIDEKPLNRRNGQTLAYSWGPDSFVDRWRRWVRQNNNKNRVLSKIIHRPCFKEVQGEWDAHLFSLCLSDSFM